MGALLVRGLLAGVLAGLLAFGFARVFGEPEVDRAVALEEQHIAATGAPVGRELVGRRVQASLGLLVGVVVYGAALGGIFALVFAFMLGRAGPTDPRLLAGLLALAGFVTLAFVPGLKYPANPPAIGDHATVAYRSALFLFMLVSSIGAAALAMAARTALLPARGAWAAGLAGAGVFVIAVGAAMLLLPEVDEVPDGFPATLLWRFRLASLGTQGVMWTALGLVFGSLTRRSLAARA